MFSIILNVILALAVIAVVAYFLYRENQGIRHWERTKSTLENINNSLQIEIDSQKKTINSLNQQITKLTQVLESLQQKPTPSVVQATRQAPSAPDEPAPAACVLYARSSNGSMELTQISDNYQAGKSYYQISLKQANDTQGVLTLCPETHEAILKKDISFITPVCTIKEKAAQPTRIEQTHPGTVSKQADGWRVELPIEIKML